nr:hypothetical protein [uncultured Desulfobacter sp.]
MKWAWDAEKEISKVPFFVRKKVRKRVEKDTLAARFQALLVAEDLLGFLRKNVPGTLRFHHEFQISFSHYPNACSQPQITDIDIIAAVYPRTEDAFCSGCLTCVDICNENAVALSNDPFPLLIPGRALATAPACAPVPRGAFFQERRDIVLCSEAG